MVRKTKKSKKSLKVGSKTFAFTFKKHQFELLLDDVLIFRFFRRLHGRFWGLAGVMSLIVGILVCFVIRPDLISYTTAISYFGLDVRTAPYFAGSVFFAAYGLWRWRNYLARTLKHTRPILFLITLTIIGLYMVALFPVSWYPWPHRLHYVGVFITGISIAATVIFDILLSKTRKNQKAGRTRVLKFLSFILIVSGGWLTFCSTQYVGWLQVPLVGELMMLAGYALWIAIKTYQGEDPRSGLSHQLKRIVLVD